MVWNWIAIRRWRHRRKTQDTADARQRKVETTLARLGVTKVVVHWRSGGGSGSLPLEVIEQIVEQLSARLDSEL